MVLDLKLMRSWAGRGEPKLGKRCAQGDRIKKPVKALNVLPRELMVRVVDEL